MELTRSSMRLMGWLRDSMAMARSSMRLMEVARSLMRLMGGLARLSPSTFLRPPRATPRGRFPGEKVNSSDRRAEAPWIALTGRHPILDIAARHQAAVCVHEDAPDRRDAIIAAPVSRT